MHGLVSLLLCGVIITSSDPLKKEILMTFAGLPVDKGVRAIIEESSLEFDQWKTQITLTDGNNTETWQAKLPEYRYLIICNMASTWLCENPPLIEKGI